MRVKCLAQQHNDPRQDLNPEESTPCLHRVSTNQHGGELHIYLC